MNTWKSTDAQAICAPQEVRIATARPDGSLRRPRTIWIVGDGDRVFVRSTNGRTADWFRAAISTGRGQIIADGTARDVIFAEADDSDLPTVDAAFRAKYGRYASVVDHLLEAGPRAATLQVHPALIDSRWPAE